MVIPGGRGHGHRRLNPSPDLWRPFLIRAARVRDASWRQIFDRPGTGSAELSEVVETNSQTSKQALGLGPINKRLFALTRGHES